VCARNQLIGLYLTFVHCKYYSIQECKVQTDRSSAKKPKSLFGVCQERDGVHIATKSQKSHQCVTGIAQLWAFQREKRSNI